MLENLGKIDAALTRFCSRPGVAFNALLLVILTAHGYEIFNLHLTIDEEVHAGLRGVAMAWIEQGRWGMGLLSTLLPSSVVPVASTALGVGLLAASLWLTVARLFNADHLASVCAVSLGMTLPVLAFTMSFATLAYGIGFASLAAVAFLALQRQTGILGRLGAAATGAFAIAVYQPMLFALAALSACELFRADRKLSSHVAIRTAVVFLGAIFIYLGIDQFVRRALQTEMVYVGQFFDLAWLIAHPLEQLTRAAHEAWAIIRVTRRLFALHSPWLEIFTLAAILAAAIPTKSAREATRFVTLIGMLLLLAVPIVAEMFGAGAVPIRSTVYFPFVICLVAALALKRANGAVRVGLVALVLLAVLGNSIISNRLYAAASLAYDRDRSVAQDIAREIAKIETNTARLRIEVVGKKSWPESALIPKRETLGASFLEWDDGNRDRVVFLLNHLGLEATSASNQEIIRVVEAAQSMPSWPKDGWVRRENGLTLVKLSEFTETQSRALCLAGARELCR